MEFAGLFRAVSMFPLKICGWLFLFPSCSCSGHWPWFPNVKKIKLAYEYQDMAKEHRELLKENHLLTLERESLRSLDRVYLLAKNEVGMKEPNADKVITIFLK